eukprot:6172382-Pleurochrysis_carterae.AAC.1
MQLHSQPLHTQPFHSKLLHSQLLGSHRALPDSLVPPCPRNTEEHQVKSLMSSSLTADGVSTPRSVKIMVI